MGLFGWGGGGVDRQWPALGLRAGALPWRRTADGQVEILLVRRHGRNFWSIPKGRPMRGRELHQTAEIEASEEGGISGRIGRDELGRYVHAKSGGIGGAVGLAVEVVLFPLEVTEIAEQWQEMASRERVWVRPEQAVSMVAPGRLRPLIGSFSPARENPLQLQRN